MKHSSYSIAAVALLSICTALPALAEQPKKPTQSAPPRQTLQPIRPAENSKKTQESKSDDHRLKGPDKNGRNRDGHGVSRDRRRWTDEDRRVWTGGHWGRGRECHFGQCGYWWWAGGYWYLYDRLFDGPPEIVSAVAFDDDGNPMPVEEVQSPVSPAWPVVVQPPLVVVPTGPICLGPLCVR